MKPIIAVIDIDGRREYAAAQLPLPLGTGADGVEGIRLSADGPGAVAFLGFASGRFFLQPGPDSQAGRLDGASLDESRWIEGGELFLARGCAVRFELDGSALNIRVDPDPEDRVTVPPLVAESSPVASSPATPVPIQPVAFERTRPGKRSEGRRFPLVGAIISSGLALLAVSIWFMFTARSVEVIVSPVPDKMWISGGLDIPVGARYLIRPGTYTLHARLEGYEPLADEIEITDERDQTLRRSLERLADRLFVTTPGVEAARVLVDGEEIGSVPLADVAIRPGRYRIEIAADRYVTEARDLDVEGGGNPLRLEVALQPDWAEVTIASNPPGAEVLADGQQIGVTPFTGDLDSGLRQLELRSPGFKTWRKELEVQAGVPQRLPTVALEPSDGRLSLRTDPAGATILVDGEFRGRSPLTLDLDPGRRYRIQATLPGHKSASKNVSLRSGEERRESLRLPAVTGEIQFVVKPAGVELFIDGKQRGPVPDKLALIAVPQRFEFRKPGFASQSLTVNPKPGLAQKVEITLLTEAAARMAAIPARIQTQQGAELVLLPGGRFTMGTKRGSPGRRANEGLREIEISRPYYLGIKEVSNREFRAFRPNHASGTAVGYGMDGEDYPVVRVTWQDAAAYCNWLSKEAGLEPAYKSEAGRLVAIWPAPNGFRLPSEAEWAWAARYTGRSQKPPRYPWGNALPPPPKAGNFADVSARGSLGDILAGYNDSYPATAPLATFRSNSLGIFDLGGNVAEWTNDLYRAYVGTAATVAIDPVGAEEGRYYVIRGSSWAQGTIPDLRLAARAYGDEARPDLGFRIARSVDTGP